MPRYGRNGRFFHSLSPLAHKLDAIAISAPHVSSAPKDHDEAVAKQQAKLARRAARARIVEGGQK
ncbi:hypothetical protein DyAD56_16085 [Dyella sp. AD56]|uniref:hypothetical protein n=1 Tax=Dyella sp. AD56 TaxID=1528744 RepID=UPI000C826C1E|nr:hypothetical protein [Dyella sp. AD56]PMQ04208.1 hypothetical protein DyAD56_16085 [Dyella sp. AD56]